MTAALCLGTNKDGSLCNRKANRATGYCAHHEPKNLPATVPIRRVCGEHSIHELDSAAQMQECARMVREAARANVEMSQFSLREAVDAIVDLETLKAAEKRILQAVIDGEIDSKSAPAIVQLLKHQSDLIKDTKPKDEELTDPQKQHVIQRSKSMSSAEAWDLLQDFVGGIAKMAKDAREHAQPAVDAQDVQEVEVNNGTGQTENLASERDSGLPDAATTVADEVF